MEEIKTYEATHQRSRPERDSEHPVYVKEHIQHRRGKGEGMIEVHHPARWQKARGR